MVPWYDPRTWGKKSQGPEYREGYREGGISEYDQNLHARLQQNHEEAIKNLNKLRTERAKLDRQVLKALECSMKLTTDQLREYVREYRNLVVDAEEILETANAAIDSFRRHDDYATSELKRLKEKNDKARENAIHALKR